MRLSERLSEQGEGIFCKVIVGHERVTYEDVTEEVEQLENAFDAELNAAKNDYARYKRLEAENKMLGNTIDAQQAWVDKYKAQVTQLEAKLKACAEHTSILTLERHQLEAENERLRDAAEEAKDEIEYCHKDMLAEVERGHPRGSGWARVWDKLSDALKESE